MTTVGYATLSVIPSMKGMGAALDKEAKPALARFGDEAGQQVGSHMQKGMADKVSKTNFDRSSFKREGDQLGDVMGKQVAQGVEKRARGINLSGIALGIGAGAAGLAVFGKQSFDAYTDQVEAIGKTQIVFGDSASKVTELAANSAKALGLSKLEAYNAAGGFGALFRAMNMGEGTSADMSVTLTKLGADLGAFYNTSGEDALMALRSGLVGESEPLRRFGVNLNEARISAEALRMGLVKGNVNMVDVQAKQIAVSKAQDALNTLQKKGGATGLELAAAQSAVAKAQQTLEDSLAGNVPVLDASSKAQAAYSLIMQDTALAQGNFALTAGNAAQQSKTASAAFEDLKATFGEEIAPIGSAILTGALFGLEAIRNWWTEHGQGIKQWFTDTFGADPAANFHNGLRIVREKLDAISAWWTENIGTFSDFRNGLQVVQDKLQGLSDWWDTEGQSWRDSFLAGWTDLEKGAIRVHGWVDTLGGALIWIKDRALDPFIGAMQTLFDKISGFMDNEAVKLFIKMFGGVAGASAGVADNAMAGGAPGPAPRQEGIGKWLPGGSGFPTAAKKAPLPIPNGSGMPPGMGGGGYGVPLVGTMNNYTIDPAANARENKRQLRSLQTMSVN